MIQLHLSQLQQKQSPVSRGFFASKTFVYASFSLFAPAFVSCWRARWLRQLRG